MKHFSVALNNVGSTEQELLRQWSVVANRLPPSNAVPWGRESKITLQCEWLRSLTSER